MEVQQKQNDSNAEIDEQTKLFCDPCETDGEQIPADGYCVNCDEYLCPDCYKVHLRPSLTRHHVLKDKYSMPVKPTLYHEICQIHEGQPIEYFCQSHKALCCSLCVSASHEKCKDTQSITDMLEDLDTNRLMDDVKREIKELELDVTDTQYQVKTNLQAVAMNYNGANSKMTSLRRKVNEHFDGIENILSAKLRNIRDDDFEKINLRRSKCEAIRLDIDTLEDFLEKNVNEKHKYKAFIAMKKAENKVLSNRNELRRIRENSTVQRYEYAELDIENLRSDISTFGDVKLHTDRVKKSRQKVGTFSAKTDRDTQNCLITGLTVVSEKYLAIADNNNMSVKMMNITDKKIVSQKMLDTSPWDLTCTKDGHIVLTLPSQEKMQFFVYQEGVGLESVKEVKVGKKCYGIEYIATENTFIVSSRQPSSVGIFDMEGRTVKVFNMTLDVPHYVAWIPSEKQIVISDIRINRKNEYIEGRVLYATYDSVETEDQLSFDMLDNSTIQPLALATDFANGIFLCDNMGKVYFISQEKWKEEKKKSSSKTLFGGIATKATQASSGYKFLSHSTGTALFGSTSPAVSLSYQNNEGHPEVLIDYTRLTDNAFRPRSLAFCKKTFTLYVGTSDKDIQAYVVA